MPLERVCFKIDKEYIEKLRTVSDTYDISLSKTIRFFIKYVMLNNSNIEKAIKVGLILEEGIEK